MDMIFIVLEYTYQEQVPKVTRRREKKKVIEVLQFGDLVRDIARGACGEKIKSVNHVPQFVEKGIYLTMWRIIVRYMFNVLQENSLQKNMIN